MGEKADQRRKALRDRLIAAARVRIERDGFRALRARDLAQDAGCALGAIYNVFDDLNALVLAVNGATFRRLGEVVARSVSGAGGQSPNQRLIMMSTAYLHFASAHNNLWRALFDIQMPSDGPVPEWYLEELGKLFAHISAPLAEIFPDRDADRLDLMTRTLFSSVHGIVLLGLERRISGVPVERIEEMIAELLHQIGNR